MNYRGKLFVIPNEEDNHQEFFERKIETGKKTYYYLQEFSDLYELGLKFNEEDYQVAPYQIAELGHLVVKTDNELSLAVCYLPEIITDKQYTWLCNNQNKITTNAMVVGLSLEKYINNTWAKINGIKQIMTVANKKNLIKEERRK